MENIKKYKVLLVEDHPLICKAHLAILEKLGCRVDCVMTGREAVRKALEGYDFIFMDIGLPDISGIEAAKKIRLQEGRKKEKIIALTAFSDDGTKIACINAGIDGFLSKPVTKEALLEIIYGDK